MRPSLRLLVPALLLLLAATAAAGDPPAAGPPAGEGSLLVETLDNGLQVVIEERHATPLVHVQAFMRIGSLYEGEYLGCGLSHYMEHIVSGGSTRRLEVGPDGVEHWVGRTEEENKVLLKSIGGLTNAATFFDYTKYWITTRGEMVGTAVDLIASYLQHCQFDPVEVEREQRVVQQELLRNLDNPGRAQNQLFTETMFQVHPARVPIIGYVDCIERVTRDDMMRFYARHYTPQNCVVAVVGDVDRDEVLALLREHFGGWARKPLEPYVIPDEPPQTAARWVEKEHGSTRTCQVTMGVPTIPLLHPDLYALDMLANVLGSSGSARLPALFEHAPLREVTATGISCGNWTPVFGAGRLVVHFSTDTAEHARQLVGEIWTEMERLREELVNPVEIERALQTIEKGYWLGKAKLEDRADALASNLAWVHDPLFSDRYLERMREVTPEQVREAARRWLVPEHRVVAILKPVGEEATAAGEGDREAEGAVRKVVLDNGLVLLLKRVPDLGLVDVCAAFPGGVIHEDEATNGLFFLMANAMWRGTEHRAFPDLLNEMDALGMSLGAESHNNVWFVKASLLSSRLVPSLQVVADVMLHPAIDPAWVERVKTILLRQVLPNLEVNAEETLQRVLRQELYPVGPYGRQRYGTPATVASFTPEQVRACYETYARPNGCVLAVYGDLDLDETEATLRGLFSDWAPAPIPASHAVAVPVLEAPKTVELENDQVRTNYRIAWNALSRQDTDARRAALSVMNAMLGANGWLHSRLREGDADYVYAVSSAPYTGDLAGHLAVTTDFSPEDEATVVGIIQGAIADMRAGRFTDEELELARRMMLCWDALAKGENAEVASGDALSELYGQGYDHDEVYYAAVRKVTREDVVAVAEEIFSRPALQVFVRPRAAPAEGADSAGG